VSPRNIRILVEYDGSGYLGWQTQLEGPSIQSTLTDALFAVTGERPVIEAAGRTDAGVHAQAQVVCFQVESAIAAERFAPALNAHLPEAISVHLSEEVPLSFSARHDSTSKRYRYRIYNARQPAALEALRAWHIRQQLDLDAMRAAAKHLVGELDFESFRSAQCDAEHARREMFSIVIDETPRGPVGRYVDITFHANAFCRHMCRILAGTLTEVGRKRTSPDAVLQIRDARDRTKAGVTAPPWGLTLLQVIYP
jgi:tRNA pseudouridine38-40 synthase